MRLLILLLLVSIALVSASQVGAQEAECKYRWLDRDGNGTKVKCSRSGKKKSATEHVDRKRHGRHYTWHENGQKSVEGAYANGRKDGKFTMWYPRQMNRCGSTGCSAKKR
jgi:antitoxin component YwqK of YwqJK toxin-antitoxin module